MILLFFVLGYVITINTIYTINSITITIIIIIQFVYYNYNRVKLQLLSLTKLI